MYHAIKIRHKNGSTGYHSIYTCPIKCQQLMSKWQEYYPDMKYYYEKVTPVDTLKVKNSRGVFKGEVQVKFSDSVGFMEVQK